MTLYQAITLLRDDASQRGLHFLAIIYTHSLMRMNGEQLAVWMRMRNFIPAPAGVVRRTSRWNREK